ncbi:hypothetical protein KIN34_12660 [Cellulomonas sp. DKR-3]|uniref:Uncharacterized protein n=1 Tax=Cellulomonas fulva TaxID=2835530 RepID=A0ABS5U154_9CELL|nr:hypothetical protein [Cellulomonas fulva]MBT0995133.1 hypothetical protein [Cellulomonas fulva]
MGRIRVAPAAIVSLLLLLTPSSASSEGESRGSTFPTDGPARTATSDPSAPLQSPDARRPARHIDPGAGGSRAYGVESIEELAARADVIVVARMGDDAVEEPADEEGESGLSAVTTSAAVAEWIKGDGRATLPVTQLPLDLMAEEISRLDPGSTYALFMHETRLRGSARFILVGGVGAYKIEPDGSLVRSDESADTFPHRYTSLDALKQDVSDAPTQWGEWP